MSLSTVSRCFFAVDRYTYSNQRFSLHVQVYFCASRTEQEWTLCPLAPSLVAFCYWYIAWWLGLVFFPL